MRKIVRCLIPITLFVLSACAKPHEFQGVIIEEPRDVYDATGINQQEEPYRLSKHTGKVVLVNFGYTFCPDICPLTLSEMSQFYRTLAEEDAALSNQVDVLFVTVEPKRDTPERLQQYLGAFHDDFTGLYIADEEELEITKSSFAVYSAVAEGSDPESDNYFVDHTGGIFVLDKEGKWRMFFPHDVTADVLLADIVALLKG